MYQLPKKVKKALPLFLNGAAFIALGAFTLSGIEPGWWMPVTAFVASGVNIFFGVSWKAPEE